MQEAQAVAICSGKKEQMLARINRVRILAQEGTAEVNRWKAAALKVAFDGGTEGGRSVG